MFIPDGLRTAWTLHPVLVEFACAELLTCDVWCNRERVVGRNCKFLQGPGTDPAVIDRLRQALCAPAPKPITVCSVLVP